MLNGRYSEVFEPLGCTISIDNFEWQITFRFYMPSDYRYNPCEVVLNKQKFKGFITDVRDAFKKYLKLKEQLKPKGEYSETYGRNFININIGGGKEEGITLAPYDWSGMRTEKQIETFIKKLEQAKARAEELISSLKGVKHTTKRKKEPTMHYRYMIFEAQTKDEASAIMNQKGREGWRTVSLAVKEGWKSAFFVTVEKAEEDEE